MADVPESTVEVVPYSEAWHARFAQERAALAAAVGSIARSIEHIGSTAVPGLAAKPTIDILMVVDDPAAVLERLKFALATEHGEDRKRYVTEKARWVDGLLASLRQDRPRSEGDRREALRVTFDEDADAYDRSRPVAPDDVFDEALERASLVSGSSVLEIGPGTGQATRPRREASSSNGSGDGWSGAAA